MHLFPTGIAGCCAKTTIAPLDRIKILLQAQNPHYKHLGISSRHEYVCSCVYLCVFWKSEMTVLLFLGVFATLKAVPQKEGFIGLYKGNGAMMVRIFPYGAIQFMAFENYKKVPSFTCAPIHSILFTPKYHWFCFCVWFAMRLFMILLHLFIFYAYIGENIDLCFLSGNLSHLFFFF